ncbi:hypothetical protein GGS21DRAFT_528392 [Xylaria nigripes]|nr:hypothetical protein GGS21DRAFT_528392 [Xylaria nigripes]
MSAPGITYSGVLAGRGAGSSKKRNIFQNVQFWLSARVPQRKTYIDTIKENGGTIVLKERDADMLICDPGKDPVPDAYSYRLIDDAIKEGSLDSKEDYLCSAPATQAGPSRPATKTKHTRNKFVEEDDRLLTKFVIEKERLGQPTSGNGIFIEFAKQHPHHTWQSWRDRWVKRLKNIRRRPISDEESSPRPNDRLIVSSRGATASRNPVAQPRARFTAEEDEFILETIHNAIENREPWNGYQPYKQLAGEFPQRTYTSWRDRALNHVANQNVDLIKQWELEADFHSGDVEDVTINNTKGKQIQREETSSGATSPAASPQKGYENENVRTGNVNGYRKEDVADKVISGNETKQKGHGAVSSPMHSADFPGRSPVLDLGVSVTTKEQFYRDYNTFLESVGIVGRQIPTVGGRAIALWDLWQSTRSKEHTDELDWQQIAEDLGFDWVSMESVPTELQQCYEGHLAPFAEAMMGFNDFSDDDMTNNDTDRESVLFLPSSPPERLPVKRPFAAINQPYEQAFSQLTPKRRKLDRNHEVPSTPDNVNGTSHLRIREDADKRSSTRNSNHRTTTIISKTQPSLKIKDQSSEDESINQPILPRRLMRRFESESEDISLSPDARVFTGDEVPGHSDYDSQAAVTPSQQLRFESEVASAETQRHVSVPVTFHEDDSQITPTRPRMTQISFEPGGSNGRGRRKSKRAESDRGPLSSQQTQPKRRTLPVSFESKGSNSARSKVLKDGRSIPTSVRDKESSPRPSSVQETPDDIIDHFISLGYTRNIVLRSLKATSWIISNAGQVMEMLKRGEPLPPRTTGVWTERDDDSLVLVYSDKSPSNDKEKKKQEKEMRRLQAKHGAEQIALRKRYVLEELSE